MNKEKLQTLAKKYPNVPQETIEILLAWWNPRFRQFHAPGGTRSSADTVVLTPSDVYDRLEHYGQKPPTKEIEEEWKAHNRDLLSLLRNEFGWQEEDERFFPDLSRLFD